MQKFFFFFFFFLMLLPNKICAFQSPTSTSKQFMSKARSTPNMQKLHHYDSLSSLNSLSLDHSYISVAKDVEEWRQYVPLGVSFGVILDILLGSPLANLALGYVNHVYHK